MATFVAAALIANELLPLLDSQLIPPAYAAAAVAVPTFTLPAWVTVNDSLRPPAPVTDAGQGVNADPVYVAEAGHDTVVADGALAITNEPDTTLANQFTPPAYVAVTLAD